MTSKYVLVLLAGSTLFPALLSHPPTSLLFSCLGCYTILW